MKKENIVKTFKGIAYGAITISALYGFIWNVNYLVNNGTKVELSQDEKRTTRLKSHGAFSHTRECISEKKDGSIYHSIQESKLFKENIELVSYKSEYGVSDEVTISGFSKYISYEDGGLYGDYDGLVDRIYISGLHPINGLCGDLDRNEHYEKYKELFDEGDRVLAKTKKKFEHQLKEDSF